MKLTEGKWRLASECTEAELAIAMRRFGRDHDKPCASPSTLTCAMFECQRRNRCRLLPLISTVPAGRTVLAADPTPNGPGGGDA